VNDEENAVAEAGTGELNPTDQQTFVVLEERKLEEWEINQDVEAQVSEHV